MPRPNLTLVKRHCPPCDHMCVQRRDCPFDSAQAIAREARISEQKRIAALREHYKPSPWWARVDWLRILETWGAALIFVAVLAAGSSLDIPRR